MRPLAIGLGVMLVAWFAFALISWSVTKQAIAAGILGLILIGYGLRRSWE